MKVAVAKNCDNLTGFQFRFNSKPEFSGSGSEGADATEPVVCGSESVYQLMERVKLLEEETAEWKWELQKQQNQGIIETTELTYRLEKSECRSRNLECGIPIYQNNS